MEEVPSQKKVILVTGSCNEKTHLLPLEERSFDAKSTPPTYGADPNPAGPSRLRALVRSTRGAGAERRRISGGAAGAGARRRVAPVPQP